MLKKMLIPALIVAGSILIIIVVYSCSDLAFRDQLEDSVMKWYQQAKLTAGDEAETDSNYGSAVAISGDFAVVGAYGKDVDINADTVKELDVGAVYVYKRNGRSWELFQPPIMGTQAAENLGQAVDISGNLLIIGAPASDPAAYIYENTGTAFVKIKTIVSDRDPNVYDVAFGTTVAIDGDWAVVGDSFYDWEMDGNNEGAAFVYSKNTGWAEQKIRPQNPGIGYEFGFAVDISGNSLVVSAKHNDSKGINSGAVYIYEQSESQWGTGVLHYENKMLTAPNGQPGDNFGYSVNISQDHLIVGATGNGGFITIFRKTNMDWNPDNQLTIKDLPSTDKVGYNVGISDQFVVFGASDNNIATVNDGAFYIFRLEKNQWNFFSKYTIDTANNQFGNAVGIFGDYIISSALGATVNNNINSGSIYIYYRE